jgi:lipopolysaccharide biosynthesis glycosyltransferase
MEETLSMEEKWFADHHVTFNSEQYFCAGLAILNLRRFREESYMMKVTEFLRVHEDVKFADQTALNAILLHDAKLLDKKWHTLTACAQKNSLLQPTTLHFAGDAPWKISKREDLLSDTAMLWFHYYAHVIGSSAWKCLRCRLTFTQIIFKRLFFLLFASSKIAKAMLFFLFHLLQRDDSTRYFKVRLRRVQPRRSLIPT